MVLLVARVSIVNDMNNTYITTATNYYNNGGEALVISRYVYDVLPIYDAFIKDFEQSMKECEWLRFLRNQVYWKEVHHEVKHKTFHRLPIPYRMDRLIGKREKRIGRK